MSHNLSGPLNANGNEIQNPRLHNLAAAPASPAKGRMYYNTGDDFIYVYTGAAWRQLVTLTQLVTYRLDQFAVPTADLNLNGVRIINQADAINPQDSVTLNQLTAAITGLKWKDAARVASTAAIATASGLLTVDGIQTVAGDRVLRMGDGVLNGLWVAAAGAWARSTDADTAAEVLSMVVPVIEGSGNADKIYLMITNAPITLGTTSLVFTTLPGGISYSSGAGISISGNIISIDTTVVARKFTTTIGNGSATSITVTHNFNTKAVQVGLRKVSTDEHWLPDVTSSTVNAVTLSFATAPASNEFETIIVG